MSKWTNNWQKLLMWVAGYVSFIGYILVGGYFIIKGDDDLKAEAKKGLIVSLIFLVLDMLILLINNFTTLSSTSSVEGMIIFGAIVSIAKVATFIVMAALAFFSKAKEEPKEEAVEDSKE